MLRLDNFVKPVVWELGFYGGLRQRALGIHFRVVHCNISDGKSGVKLSIE